MVTWDIGAWMRPEPTGTFKLAAGEVIYIGHLVFEPGNSVFGGSEDNKVLKIRVEDRFDEYRAELPPAFARCRAEAVDHVAGAD